MTTALGQGGVKDVKKFAPNKGKGPVRTAGKISAKANLAKTAATVNEANTPHKNLKAPGLAIVFYADLDKESAKKAEKALSKVKGVDAKKTQADPKKDQISVKLSGKKPTKWKVTLADLTSALGDAGIDAKLKK